MYSVCVYLFSSMIQLQRNNFRILQPPSSHLSFIHSTSHYLSIIMILIIGIILCGIIDLDHRTVQAQGIIQLSPFIHHLSPSPLSALSSRKSSSTIDTRPVIKRRSDRRLDSTLHSIVDSLLTPIHSERSPNGWRGYVFVDPLFKPSSSSSSSSSPSSGVQSSLSSKIMLPTSGVDPHTSSSVFQGSESEPIPYIVSPPADMYMSSSNNRHTRRMADGRRASASSATYTYRFPSLRGGSDDGDDSDEDGVSESSSKKKSSSTRKRSSSSSSTRTTTPKPSPAISIGHSSEGGTSIRLGKAQITFKKGSISLGPAEDPVPEASISSSKSTASPNKVPNSNQRERSSPSKFQPQEEHLPSSSRYSSSRRSRRPLRPDIQSDKPLSEEHDEIYGPSYVPEEEDGEADYGSEYTKSNQDPLYKASASGYYHSYKPFQTGRIQAQRKRGRYGYSPPPLFPELMDDTTTASSTSLTSTVSSTKLKSSSRGKAKRRTVNSSARLASNRDKLLNFDDYEPSSDGDEDREMTASKAEKLRKLRQRLGISEDYDDKENTKSKIKIQEQHGNTKKTLLDQIEDDDDDFFIKGTDLLNMPVSSVDKKSESKKREKKMTDTESNLNPAKVSVVDDSDEDDNISKFLVEENSRSNRKSGKTGSSENSEHDEEPEMDSSRKKKGSSSSSSIDTESRNLRKEHRSTASDDPDDDPTVGGEVRNDRQRSNTSSSPSSSGSSRSNRNRKQRPSNRDESSSDSSRSGSSSVTRSRKNKKQSSTRSDIVEIITRSPNEKSSEDADRVYFGASNHPKTRVGASKKNNPSTRKIVIEESDDEDTDPKDTKNEMDDKSSGKSEKNIEDKVSVDSKSESFKTSTEETPIPVGPYEKVGNVYQIRLTSRVAPVKESGDVDGESGPRRSKKRKNKTDQTHDDDNIGDLNAKNITSEQILAEKAEELAFKKLFLMMQETLADIKKTANQNQKVTPCPPELNSNDSLIETNSTKSIGKNKDSTGPGLTENGKENSNFTMGPVDNRGGVNISVINPLMNVTSISELMKMLVKSGQIISSSQIVPLSSNSQNSSRKNDSILYIDPKDFNESKSKKPESVETSSFSIEPLKDSSKEFNDYTIDLDSIPSESAKQRKGDKEKSTTSKPENKSSTTKKEIISSSPMPEVSTISSIKNVANNSESSSKTNDNDVPIIVVLLPPELENSSR